ncbi:MAG: ABC transporter permease subunit [Thermoplasmata archaeon]|nr:ABC transporter permease subunit [Thermoplasmata archaeon]
MRPIRWPLVKELARKDLEEIAQSRQLLYPLFVVPVFLTGDALLTFSLAANGLSTNGLSTQSAFFTFAEFLLLLPVILPILLGASSVVLEKSNRTLEPLLSTPLTDTELLVGKALAPLVPALALTGASYTVYSLGALAIVNSREPLTNLPWGSLLLAAFVLAPLLGLLSTFVALAVSTKAKEVRSAQQIATLLILPLLLAVIGVGLAVGPNLLGQLAFALAIAAVAYAVLQVTVSRFHRDQILVAGV